MQTEGIFFLLFFIIAIVYTVIWIITLVSQAKQEKWVWFVLTLLFSIVLIPYWIFGK